MNAELPALTLLHQADQPASWYRLINDAYQTPWYGSSTRFHDLE